MNQSIDVRIAGIGFRVNSPEQSVRAKLAHDFRPFLHPLAEPLFNLEILGPMNEREIDSFPPVRVDRRGESVSFEMEGTAMADVDLRRGRARILASAMEKGYAEAFIRSVFNLFLHQRGGFLIHACSVVNGNRGYLFPGVSGCGKSTIAHMSAGKNVLSDELSCVIREKGDYTVCGTPWRGNSMKRAKIRAIVFPKRGRRIRFSRAGKGECLDQLVSTVVYPCNDTQLFGNMLSFAGRMAETIPSYNMYFNLSSDIWRRMP